MSERESGRVAGRGICGAGSRIVAALAALAILFGAQAVTRLQHGVSGDAFRSPSPATSFAALHAAPANRAALTSRSSARWPSSIGVPLLVHLQDASSSRLAHQIAIAPAIGLGESGRARGYDATAPPALS